MLSKPSLESSPGSSAAASIGRSSRSRTAFAYSARFRRCSAGAPGFGAAARRDRDASSSRGREASSVARSGRGAPAGGIMPVRSLRIDLLPHLRLAAGGVPTSSAVEREAAGARARALWQVTQ